MEEQKEDHGRSPCISDHYRFADYYHIRTSSQAFFSPELLQIAFPHSASLIVLKAELITSQNMAFPPVSLFNWNQDGKHLLDRLSSFRVTPEMMKVNEVKQPATMALLIHIDN